MAEPKEQQTTEPTAGKAPSDPIAKTFEAATDRAVKDARAALGQPVPEIKEAYELPALQELDLKAYTVTSSSVTERVIRGVVVDDKIFGRATGYDFLLMRIAAAMDGIDLEPVSAYRRMEQQVGLYNDRWVIPYPQITYAEHRAGKNRLSASGVKNGRAAYPGTSNHQSGKAIDIYVGISIAAFNSGKGQKSPQYLWLERNAAAFGFDNKEAPEEPWHWRHTSDNIVGKITGLTAKGLTQAELASLRSAPSVPGARRFDVLQAWQQVKADGRRDPATTSRATLLAMAVGGKLRIAGNKAQNRALASLQANTASLASTSGSTGVGGTGTPAPPPPRGMQDGAQLYAFDFTTGRWNDGGVV